MATPQSGIIPDTDTDAQFLILTIKENDSDSLMWIRQTISAIPELTQSLSTQYTDARLSSTISIGSNAWEQALLWSQTCCVASFYNRQRW